MIRNMDLEHILGLMEGSMKDNMIMTKNMALVLSIGQMGANIMVLGKMGSSMVEESTTWCQDKRELENGLKERE